MCGQVFLDGLFKEMPILVPKGMSVFSYREKWIPQMGRVSHWLTLRHGFSGLSEQAQCEPLEKQANFMTGNRRGKVRGGPRGLT